MFVLNHLKKALGLLLLSCVVSAEPLTIAVAANFIQPMNRLAMEFERQSSHKVKLVSGSSGRFFAQISHGAPFDVFLSADADKPQKLIAAGLALPGTAFTYAVGRLVLWSPDTHQEISQTTLAKESYSYIALANAKLAPYGKAAKEVLANLSLDKRTRSKWVVGENIAQAYQFVASENADYGFIAASQWQGKGSGWLIPETLHQPIRQDAVILTRAKNKKAAFEFVEFLQSVEAAVITQDYGYQVKSNK